MEHIEAWSPTATVAKRVREARTRLGLTAGQLAERLVDQGVPWERSTVAKLENGNRQNLTLTEWLALSVVLNVAPIHLLVPPLPSPSWDVERSADSGRVRNTPNDEDAYQVTPSLEVPIYRVRQFIRGARPLPGADQRAYHSEVPPQEFSPLVERRGSDGEHPEAPER